MRWPCYRTKDTGLLVFVSLAAVGLGFRFLTGPEYGAGVVLLLAGVPAFVVVLWESSGELPGDPLDSSSARSRPTQIILAGRRWVATVPRCPRG
jgi:hypothetical protein